MQYDLGIIGAGPAGYVAAIRAGQAGLKTVLFDKHYIGGVCLNEGCIPTKTLLHTAKLYSHARSGSKYGLRINKVEVDMAALMKRKQKMVRKLVGGVKSQLKDSQVEVVMDQARISDSSLKKVTVEAGSHAYQCTHLLIATGSEPVYPPIPGLQQEQVYTSAEILQISELPEELTIIGGGVIGIEFADFFASMGTRVTVIEMLDEIIGVMDSEIAAMLRKELTRKGVDFKLGAQVTQMEGKTLTYRMQDKDYTHQAGQILLSVGRKPVLHIPGMNKLGLNYNNRGIETDAWCRTNIPNVYAAGDVNGYSLYAHTASREGEVAVNHILGRKDQMRYDAVPGVIYTNPEVASVGLTEEEARKQQIPVDVRQLPMAYAGRYVVENEGVNGVCKLVTGKTWGNILGVHMLGNSSSEIIATASMAIEEQLTLREFREMIFPHPTVSEIYKETAFIPQSE